MKVRFIGASVLLAGAACLGAAVAGGLTNGPPRASGYESSMTALDVLRTARPVFGSDVGVADVVGTGRSAPSATRVAPFVPPVSTLGGVLAVDPFVGDLAESFEGFLNYLENPDFYEASPATIFGGAGTIANVSDVLTIYEPSTDATFGLGTSGSAQVADGRKGLGLDTESTLARIEFAEPIFTFGAFWGCSTNETFGDPNEVALAFFGVEGNLIAVTGFPYSRSQQGADGLLEWHGWRASEPVAAIEYAGDYVVADAMQANLATPCDDDARVLDFEKLEVVNAQTQRWGEHVEEDGYQVDGPVLSSFGTLEPRYPGSTALFSDAVDGISRVSRIDGLSFNAISIDIAPLNGPDAVTVDFVGTKTNGNTVVSSFTHSGSAIVLEQHVFPPAFTDLVSLEWAQVAPYHQYDNITVNCGPCSLCPCPEDLDRDGFVAFSDILRVLAAWGDCNLAPCDTPGVCPAFENCDPNEPDCVCFTTVTGEGFCMRRTAPCEGAPPCDDGNCPPGFTCLEDTCCGPRFCFPDFEACPGDGAAYVLPPKGTRAAGGIVGVDFGVTGAAPASLGAMRGIGTVAAGVTDGTLYFSEDNNPQGLWSLSMVDAMATNVGATGVTSNTVGLAASEDPALLYGSSWVQLHHINSDGSGFVDVGGIQQEGLAYDVPTGRLYASINGAFELRSPSDGSLIATLASPGIDMEGLAPGRGFVYGLGGFNSDLFRYDPGSDAWTVVGNTGVEWKAVGLAYNASEDMLYAKNGVSDTLLYRIDPTTAGTTVVGDTRLIEGGGLAWVGPGDPCGDCPCPEDINRDGTVSFADILEILAAWGPCPGDCDDCEDGTVDRCGTEEICHDCETPDGQCVCVFEGACDPEMECADGDCPPGFFCCTNTCCGFNICLPVCEDGVDAPEVEPGTRMSGGGIR